MHVRFAVFIATSVDGFIARQDGRGLPELPLRLLEAKSFPSGLVQLRHTRA